MNNLDNLGYQNEKSLQRVVSFRNVDKINLFMVPWIGDSLSTMISPAYDLAIDFGGINFIDTEGFYFFKDFKERYGREKGSQIDFVIPKDGDLMELYDLMKGRFGNSHNLYCSLEDLREDKKGFRFQEVLFGDRNFKF